ncbi:tRNA modification GTPase [Spirochaetota bacterium]|nr:tRNA modification GTPase [Spirochaetota bacterium]
MGLIDRVAATIVQLVTPRQPGAVHIIRISGAASTVFLAAHTKLKFPLKSRYFYYTAFKIHSLADQGTNTVQTNNPPAPTQAISSSPPNEKKVFTEDASSFVIDRILCVYFKSPKSYTGEDVVELHVHGSLLIVDQILNCALRENILLAERGEFTYRAFLNGKLTLEQAEATHALIAARSDYTRANALSILEQKVSLRFQTIQQTLLKMLAKLESTIEFPEEDIPELDDSKDDLYRSYDKDLRKLKSYFGRILTNYQTGRKLEAGIKVAIIGPPNVGKSTLINALLKEERALVSSIAGTTRDYIEATIVINGVRFVLIDTAGLRVSEDAIEQAGMTKTLERVATADIVVVLLALTAGTREENLETITNTINNLASFIPLSERAATIVPEQSNSIKQPKDHFPAFAYPNQATSNQISLPATHSTYSTHSTHSTHRLVLFYLNKSDNIPAADHDFFRKEFMKKNTNDNSVQVKGMYPSELKLKGLFSLKNAKTPAVDQVYADLTSYLRRFQFDFDSNGSQCPDPHYSQTHQHSETHNSGISVLEFEEDSIALLNVRQAKLAENIIEALDHMLQLVHSNESEEVLAEEFRLLSGHFSELNLAIDHDKIYDTLFAEFCIGK